MFNPVPEPSIGDETAWFPKPPVEHAWKSAESLRVARNLKLFGEAQRKKEKVWNQCSQLEIGPEIPEFSLFNHARQFSGAESNCGTTAMQMQDPAFRCKKYLPTPAPCPVTQIRILQIAG